MPRTDRTNQRPPIARKGTSKPHLSLVVDEQTEKSDVTKWRRHPQLREYRDPISDSVRSARHEAVRGLCAARAGAAEVAVNHFVIAARCDEVELTAVPGFWTMTRGQMGMAVEAYELVGRYRDAAALDAHIATIFRPSLVGVDLKPVQPRENQKKAAST